MADGWDAVLTCTDYYDGPLKGVAEVDGIPHLYDRQFDPVRDDWSDDFNLTPLPLELVAQMLEMQAIFDRWNSAFREKRVDLSSHPALPEEKVHYEELEKLVQERLAHMQAVPVAKRATFKDRGSSFVRWTAI